MIKFLALMVFVCLAPLKAQDGPGSILGTNAHFTGGLWFDGSRFKADDFYSVDGSLTHRRPERVDAEIDLHGGYVVPPFGDAHEHYFDSTDGAIEVSRQYLHDGIFYAQGVTDIASGAARVIAARLVNTPTTVDVTYAHGGITSTGGHPKEIYEQYALNIFNYPLTAEQVKRIRGSKLRVNDAYWEVDSAEALAAMWPKLMASKPDLIKVYLLHSEELGGSGSKRPDRLRGLEPALIPLITERAHAAGLKVVAHIDSAADFHDAVVGGVDEMAHMPGYYLRPGDLPTLYELADSDIALAARRHVKVTATASLESTNATPADLAVIKRTQIANLKKLKRAGIPILMGSDFYSRDTKEEARYLHDLSVWTNVELLRLYAVTTPQAIFPKRKIGALQEGCEASFLVLRSSPIADWTATEAILDRWKQGVHLTDEKGATAAVSP